MPKIMFEFYAENDALEARGRANPGISGYGEPGGDRRRQANPGISGHGDGTILLQNPGISKQFYRS